MRILGFGPVVFPLVGGKILARLAHDGDLVAIPSTTLTIPRYAVFV